MNKSPCNSINLSKALHTSIDKGVDNIAAVQKDLFEQSMQRLFDIQTKKLSTEINKQTEETKKIWTELNKQTEGMTKELQQMGTKICRLLVSVPDPSSGKLTLCNRIQVSSKVLRLFQGQAEWKELFSDLLYLVELVDFLFVLWER